MNQLSDWAKVLPQSISNRMVHMSGYRTYLSTLYGGIIKMARIAGVDLPRDKRVEIGLTYIYGIGRTSSNKILVLVLLMLIVRLREKLILHEM